MDQAYELERVGHDCGQGINRNSRSGLFDGYVVDGAVNALADVAQFVGRRVRNLQSGAINAYLYVVLLGVLGGVLLYWSWAAAS